MKLNTVFNRLGEVNIQNYFISKEAIEIIKLMSDEQLHHPNKLRECISSHYTHLELLRNKKIRELLLENMRPDELKKLLPRLTNTSINENNVYKEMRKIPFNKNSTSEKILFEFFEEEIPEQLDEVPKLSNMEKITPKRSLFDYQRKAHEEIINYLNRDGKRCLLHMPTGSGKTITAMRVISNFFSKTKPVLIIWLAYSEELCEQAIDEFKQTWTHVGDRDMRVFRFFRNHSTDLIKNTDVDKDCLIVAGLGKISQKSKRDAVFLSKLSDRADLVVMDEAHQAIAPVYLEVLQQLTQKRIDKIPLLGLSATPGRSSVLKSDELSSFFNCNRVSLKIPGYKNPIKYLIKKGYLSEPDIRFVRSDIKLTDDDIAKISNSQIDIPDRILDIIGDDINRTIRVIGEIQDLIKNKHKRIIVFGASVKNSRDISIILTYIGHKSFHVDAKTDPISKSKSVNDYKSETDDVIIMCNVGVFTTGFDAPKTSAVVIARPTKSLVLFNQMVGRAMRGINVGGNKKCEIRIIKDNVISKFTSPVDDFFKWDDIW